MNDTPIPDAIIEAAVNILHPYAPDVTKEALLNLILNRQHIEPVEELVTRHDAVEILRLSLSTIDRMLRDGDLPRVRIRGNIRIPMSALRELIHDNTEQS